MKAFTFKRWVVLGAVAAAMTVTGCEDVNRVPPGAGGADMEGTGGAGGAGMEGTGSPGDMRPQGTGAPAMEGTGGAGGSQMMGADAGIGGSGGMDDPVEMGPDDMGGTGTMGETDDLGSGGSGADTRTPMPEGQQ